MPTTVTSKNLKIKKLLSQAKKNIKTGDIVNAEELYSTVLTLQPHNVIAKKNLNKLQRKRKKIAQIHQPDVLQNQINGLISTYHSGDMVQTEKSCNNLLQQYPQSVIVINILGASLQRQGKLKESIKNYSLATKIDPNYPDTFNNRGTAYMELNHFEESIHDYKNAIQINPNYAEAYNNLGSSLRKLNRHNEALDSYNRAITINPNYAEAYSNRSNVLIDLGEYQQAIASCKQAIAIQPNHAQAFFSKGLALQKLEKFIESIQSYQHAIKIRPDYADAYNNLGFVMHKLELIDEAIQNYKYAIKIKPECADAYYNLGTILRELGAQKESEENFNLAIRFNPDNLDAYNNLGILLQESGRFDEARQKYKHVIQIQPKYADAHYNYSIITKYKENSNTLELLKDVYADKNTDSHSYMLMSFALAKAYDDIGEYSNSYSCLVKGNLLRKNELNYNINNDKELINKIKNIFNNLDLELNTISNKDLPIKPIFIVGMPRSGTSLVEQIIASHSEVYGAGELTALNKIILSILPDFDNNVQNKNVSHTKQFNTLRDEYIKTLGSLNASELIITDKMPLNFLYIGFILCAFPEAKIIFINRDPRATCWSNYKQHFSTGNGFSYDFDDLAEFYKMGEELMSLWNRLFPNMIYNLHYENLIKNQYNETRDLLKFCDLQWEDHCLDFHTTKRLVKTASVSQVRKKIYTSSCEAWKNYRKDLQPLLDALK
jgi:tetratricopeptide (TPR) repeat protein